MDDRSAPRRLLSFDASQMSLSRWSKALYPGSGAAKAPKKPEVVVTEPNGDLSARHQARSAIVCMAPNVPQKLVALVGRDNIELYKPNHGADGLTGVQKTLVTSSRLIPTAAVWQGQTRQRWDFDPELLGGDWAGPGGHGGPGSGRDRLMVADSNGTFRVYQLTGTDLVATATSATVGRAIRSLSVNSEQPAFVIAGVSDGSVRLWDLRQKLSRPQLSFNRTGDVTREVQFQPGSEWKFASIYDSGVVQRWDIRHRQMADYRINAHQQGLSLDWHPRLNYLATGGQDHLVQIWNMRTDGATPADLLGGGSAPDLVLQVPNAVQQVKWIDHMAPSDPSSPRNLPSAEILHSGVVTTTRPLEGYNKKGSYSCWSLAQPYLPLYSVEAHSDSVSDVFVAHPKQIWSVGLDGVFAQTDLRSEPAVRDNLPPALADFPPWDSAAVSFPVTQHPVEPVLPSLTMPPFHRRASQHSVVAGNMGMTTSASTSDIGMARRPFYRANSQFAIPRNASFEEHCAAPKLGTGHNAANFALGSTAGSATSGSVPGSNAGSVPTSVPGSVPGSVPSSAPGSVPGSLPTSQPTSQPGSVPGPGLAPLPWAIPRSFSASHTLVSQPPHAPTTPVSPDSNSPSPWVTPTQGQSALASGFTSATPSALGSIGAMAGSGNGAANYFSEFANPSIAGTPPAHTVDPKFVVEVGLPYEDGSALRSAAVNFAFIKPFGQTYAQVCRHNANVMLSLSRFRYAELWNMLAIAIEDLEAAFLRSLSEPSSNLRSLRTDNRGVSGNLALDEANNEGEPSKEGESDRELALSWFSGIVDDNFEVRAVAVEDRVSRSDPMMATEEMPLFEDEEYNESQADSEWSGSVGLNHQLRTKSWGSSGPSATNGGSALRRDGRAPSGASGARSAISGNSVAVNAHSKSLNSEFRLRRSLAAGRTLSAGEHSEGTPENPRSKLTASIAPSKIQAAVGGPETAIDDGSDFAEERDIPKSLEPENHSGGNSPAQFATGRPEISKHNTPSLKQKDPFLILKERFWAFAESRQNPWDFLPLLSRFAHQLLDNGFYTSASALILVFRSFPSVTRELDVCGIIRGGLLALHQFRSFVAATEIRKALKTGAQNEDENDDYYNKVVDVSPDKEIVDIVCHRCHRSLSDNAAFYARNDLVVNYYYCSRCRLLIDGCSLCDIPIRGLGKLLTTCGHRMHMDCWNHWLAEGYQECPSGCGQSINLG